MEKYQNEKNEDAIWDLANEMFDEFLYKTEFFEFPYEGTEEAFSVRMLGDDFSKEFKHDDVVFKSAIVYTDYITLILPEKYTIVIEAKDEG